jgi:phosphatidylglycerol:prolipoprotein diacylglycerol transferase
MADSSRRVIEIGTIKVGIDPNLFDIGSLTIGWHGVMVVLAVIVGVAVPLWLAKGGGIDRNTVYAIAPWAVLGGIIGARLIHVLDSLDVYTDDPLLAIKFWEGGVSVFGAILGGTLAGVVCARLKGISVGGLADLVAPGLILAQAVGRIGCTINGDAYGTATSLPWGVSYTHPEAAATTEPAPYVGHPVTVYEIMWDLMIFALIWKLRKRIKPEGSLFLIYLSLYSFGRFFLSFLRGGEESVLGPLHQAHIIAIVVFAVCVSLLIYQMRQRKPSAELSPPSQS